MIILTSSFLKSSVLKILSVHTKKKPAFPNSSGLKRVFEKLRFRDGLVWTVGLTVKIKPHCCGHIVADTNVSPFARARNICCGHKSGHKKCF